MSKLEDAGLNRNASILSIASHEPIFCLESESILDCINKILETKHRRIPIVNRRKELVGIVTITDILDAIVRKEPLKEKISEIMVRDVIFCFDTETIGEVLLKFKLSRRGGFPIVDKKRRLEGIVSERDIVWRFDRVNFGIKVKEAMSKKPIVIPPSLSILDCLRTIVNVRYRRLPVVLDNELVGIVTSVDLLRYLKKNEFKEDSLDEELELVYQKEVYTIDPEVDLSLAIKKMKEKDVGGLLVVEGKELIGIITERDILERIE